MSVRTASARVKQHASGDDDEEAAPGGVVEAVPADAEVYERPSDQPENPDEHFQVPQLPPSMVQDRLYGSEQSPADRRTWPDSAAAWSVQGYRNDEIARMLVLTPKTIRNYISHIYEKLNVTSRGQAIVMAREAGFDKHQ